MLDPGEPLARRRDGIQRFGERLEAKVGVGAGRVGAVHAVEKRGNLEDPIYPPKAVVVSYAAGGGVAFKGRVAENLPPGALDSIRQRTASFSPEAFKSSRHHVTELDDFMVGTDSVSVKVRPVLR